MFFPLRRLSFGNGCWVGLKHPPFPTTFLLIVTYANGIICGCARHVFAYPFQQNALLFPRNNASLSCTGRNWTSLLIQFQSTGNVHKATILENGSGMGDTILSTQRNEMLTQKQCLFFWQQGEGLSVWDQIHLGVNTLTTCKVSEMWFASRQHT